MNNLLSILLATNAGGLFGKMDPVHFFWCMFFAAIGAYLSINLEANKRNVYNPETPFRFSYRILLKMNWKRITANVLAVYIVLRFSPEITGRELSEFWAFAVGLGIDRVILWFKKVKKMLPTK